MLINITDTAAATSIVTVVLMVVLILTARRRQGKELFPVSVTQELKGFAVLAILFAHTAFYLVSDNQFLVPMSYLAGPAVDLFLFISGLGLTLSALRKFNGVIDFYKSRLPKLYIPLWIVLTLLFIGAAVIHHTGFSAEYIVKSFAGIFLHANIYEDINSPLWYFTLILGYYILFPLLFNKKYPVFTAIALFAVGYILTFEFNPPLDVLKDIYGLYRIHMAAFPLGVATAWVLTEPRLLGKVTWETIQNWLRKPLAKLVYVAILALLLYVAAYTAIYSGVGKEWYMAENISLVTMAAIIVFFVLKPFSFRFLIAVGIISYEIYLLQWQLGYGYGAFVTGIPAWAAFILYVGIVCVASWILQFVSSRVLEIFKDLR